jgi:Fe-S cluster biosynthesis and repair protein YggX
MAERIVRCAKLGQELPGLEEPPWSGDLGQRIYEKVSRQAWQMWLDRLRMIINEYRIFPADPRAQKFIEEQMEQFFFGEQAAPPPGYVPPE